MIKKQTRPRSKCHASIFSRNVDELSTVMQKSSIEMQKSISKLEINSKNVM